MPPPAKTAVGRVFAEVVDVTGIVLTKLDGTAKGGIVVSVQRELGVPVKLVGLGEAPMTSRRSKQKSSSTHSGLNAGCNAPETCGALSSPARNLHFRIPHLLP